MHRDFSTLKNNEQRPVVAVAETTVPVAIETVWDILTNLEKWPDWHHGVSRIRVKGQRKIPVKIPVKIGTVFYWTSGMFRIKSELMEVDVPNRFVWSGNTLGMRALRVWQFERRKDHIHIRATETLTGLLPSVFPRLTKRILTRVVSQSLSSLKTEAEARASIP